MAILLVLGCVCIVFAVPAAVFLFIIVHDPLRIILFTLGSFFWLCSLFFASFVWFAFYPLRDSHIWISLIFTVFFQELLRFGFFALLKLAESGLTKVSVQGMHIEGVHSLINARHVVALVCGLGYGVMGGLFGVVNLLADSRGPGVPGLPGQLNTDLRPLPIDIPYYFVAISAVCVSAMVILQMCWTIIMWNGLHHLRVLRNSDLATRETPREPAFMCYVEIAVTIITHYVAVFCSLLNELGQWPVYVAILYSLLVFNSVWALRISGFVPKMRELKLRREKKNEDGMPSRRSPSHLVPGTDPLDGGSAHPSGSSTQTVTTSSSTSQPPHETIVRHRNADVNQTSNTINC